MSATVKFELLVLLVLGLVVLCAKPLGSYIADAMEGKAKFATRVGGGFERLLYRLCGVDSREEMGWAQYAVALLVFNILGALVVYGLQRLQLWLPLNEDDCRQPGLLVQHGDQLRHQHGLAGLFRRVDHGLSGADGRARRAEFPVRRHGPGGGHCADPRLRAAHGQSHRQLLGGRHEGHLVCAAAAVGRAGHRAGGPGRHPEFRRLQGRHHHRKTDLRQS